MFSERLDALVKGRFTQQQLAAAMGVSQPTVQRWQNGTMPRGNKLNRLASILGVEVQDLFADGTKTTVPQAMVLSDARTGAIDNAMVTLGHVKEHLKHLEKQLLDLKK